MLGKNRKNDVYKCNAFLFLNKNVVIIYCIYDVATNHTSPGAKLQKKSYDNLMTYGMV